MIGDAPAISLIRSDSVQRSTWTPPLVLATTTLSALLVFGNASALSVALPAMSADLDVTAATADWFLIAFLLANTAFILVFGRISDSLGRRGLYLGGLIVFTLASVGCALAPNEWWLIALRIAQGIAAACAVSNSTAVLTDVFAHGRLAVALSLNVTGGAIATLLGPMIGGFLVENFGWRSLFVANVPLGVFAILLGWRSLRSLHKPLRRRERYDYWGALLSVLGLGSLLFAVNRMSEWGLGDVRVWGCLAAAAACGAGFTIVERHTPAPLLDLGLLRGTRGLVYVSSFFTSFTFGSVLVLVVLYRQLVDGAGAAEAGLVAVPMGLAMLVGSPLSGALGRWLSPRILTSVGAATLTAGVAGLAGVFWLGATKGPLLGLCLLLCGFGEGVFMAAITRSVMIGVAANRRAIANGFRSVLHNGALALSIAVVLLIVTAWTGPSYTPVGDTATEARQGFVAAALLLSACGIAGCATSLTQRRRAPRRRRRQRIVMSSERRQRPRRSHVGLLSGSFTGRLSRSTIGQKMFGF